jgi:hypothetical protein
MKDTIPTPELNKYCAHESGECIKSFLVWLIDSQHTNTKLEFGPQWQEQKNGMGFAGAMEEKREATAWLVQETFARVQSSATKRSAQNAPGSAKRAKTELECLGENVLKDIATTYGKFFDVENPDAAGIDLSKFNVLKEAVWSDDVPERVDQKLVDICKLRLAEKCAQKDKVLFKQILPTADNLVNQYRPPTDSEKRVGTTESRKDELYWKRVGEITNYNKNERSNPVLVAKAMERVFEQVHRDSQKSVLKRLDTNEDNHKDQVAKSLLFKHHAELRDRHIGYAVAAQRLMAIEPVSVRLKEMRLWFVAQLHMKNNTTTSLEQCQQVCAEFFNLHEGGTLMPQMILAEKYATVELNQPVELNIAFLSSLKSAYVAEDFDRLVQAAKAKGFQEAVELEGADEIERDPNHAIFENFFDASLMLNLL